MGVGAVLGGDDGIVRMGESSVCHEDHRLVCGGFVACYGCYFLCHLVNIDLEGEGREER